jgi:hypothetical protein
MHVLCILIFGFRCRFGLEQEYTLLQKNVKWPLGWPVAGYPGPQVRALSNPFSPKTLSEVLGHNIFLARARHVLPHQHFMTFQSLLWLLKHLLHFFKFWMEFEETQLLGGS